MQENFLQEQDHNYLPVLKKSNSENNDFIHLPELKKRDSEKIKRFNYIEIGKYKINQEENELAFPDDGNKVNDYVNIQPKLQEDGAIEYKLDQLFQPAENKINEPIILEQADNLINNQMIKEPEIIQNPIIDAINEEKNPEEKNPEENKPEEKNPEEKNPEENKPEEKNPEENKAPEVLDTNIPVLQKSTSELFIEYLKEAPFYELSDFEPHSIKCHICITKHQEYHHLGCEHNYCISCINLLLVNYIETSYVYPDEILCPICIKTIPDEIIKKFIDDKLYAKMISLRESLKIQKLVSQNKAIYCVIPDCDGFGHIIPNEKITACFKCKCTMCTSCKGAIHPGITCEEAMVGSPDETLNELIMSENWKKCPTCGVPVEKIDGCQFITCRSPLCKSRNAMCYLCGRFVVEDQHFSHYKTEGPFGNTCNTLEGIPEDVDPTTLEPIID